MKPTNWEGKTGGKDNQGQAFPTANEAKTSPMEQMDHLLALLKSNSVSGILSVYVAHTGNELYALSILSF